MVLGMFAGARKWTAGRLDGWSRAILPVERLPVERGPAMGSWREQWERVGLGFARVKAVYDGRPEPEGTSGASYDVLAFFLNCHQLVEWIRSDAEIPRSTYKKARKMVGKSGDLALCADLANRTKHSSLTRARTDDKATGPSGNDATVTIGSGAKHAFRVSSAGVERDALELARSCTAEWREFLEARDLLPPGPT